jgi:hypothetical protein
MTSTTRALTDDESNTIWSLIQNKAAVSGEDDCWIWTKLRDEPLTYPMTTKRGCAHLDRYVHRLALMWRLGRTLFEGLNANHTCFQQRNCVNPRHLNEGTQAENMLDRIEDGTAFAGSNHPMAKLTDEHRELIQSSGSSSSREIAKQLATRVENPVQVHPSTIRRIRSQSDAPQKEKLKPAPKANASAAEFKAMSSNSRAAEWIKLQKRAKQQPVVEPNLLRLTKPCLLFQKTVRSDCGTLNVKGHQLPAKRAALFYVTGRYENKIFCLCLNTYCIEPTHLLPGKMKDSVLLSGMRGTVVKGQKHENEELYQAVLARWAAGESRAQIMAALSIPGPTLDMWDAQRRVGVKSKQDYANELLEKYVQGTDGLWRKRTN